jgi:hypothetical protein
MIESKKQKYKRWRREFNITCRERDNHRCVMCEMTHYYSINQDFTTTKHLVGQSIEVHHITNRKEIPNGGYVLENGISLCAEHHCHAETFHRFGGESWYVGFHPNDLYKLIGSSAEEAHKKSSELK